MSIAAQLAHAHAIAGPNGPAAGALIESTAWPVLTLAAVEIATRTPWPAAFGWQVLRWLGAGGVATVAAIASYVHMSGLLELYGEPRLVASLGPLAVDGLMLSAAAALLACDRASKITDSEELTLATSAGASPSDVEPDVESSTLDGCAVDLDWQSTDDTMGTSSSAPAVATPDRELSAVAKKRLADTLAAIEDDELPQKPSAEQIRRHFGGAASIARQVRDAVAKSQPAAETA